MEDAIIEKLSGYMSRKPATEAEVVYVLVQIRQLLEHKQQREKYSTLAFFCDWAVHTTLDRGARDILRFLDEYLGQYDPTQPESMRKPERVQEFVSFEILRSHLHAFCQFSKLPTVWTSDGVTWEKFIQLYGEVVRDVPLRITRDDYPFTDIHEVVLSACEPAKFVVAALRGPWFGFNWEFTRKDGKTFSLSFASPPQDPNAY